LSIPTFFLRLSLVLIPNLGVVEKRKSVIVAQALDVFVYKFVCYEAGVVERIGAAKERRREATSMRLGEVRQTERRLERSDSKSIKPPSYITNNLPLVASLLTTRFSLASPVLNIVLLESQPSKLLRVVLHCPCYVFELLLHNLGLHRGWEG